MLQSLSFFRAEYLRCVISVGIEIKLYFQNMKTMGENETVGAKVLVALLVAIVFFMSFQLCRYLVFSSFYIYV